MWTGVAQRAPEGAERSEERRGFRLAQPGVITRSVTPQGLVSPGWCGRGFIAAVPFRGLLPSGVHTQITGRGIS